MIRHYLHILTHRNLQTGSSSIPNLPYHEHLTTARGFTTSWPRLTSTLN